MTLGSVPAHAFFRHLFFGMRGLTEAMLTYKGADGSRPVEIEKRHKVTIEPPRSDRSIVARLKLGRAF